MKIIESDLFDVINNAKKSIEIERQELTKSITEKYSYLIEKFCPKNKYKSMLNGTLFCSNNISIKVICENSDYEFRYEVFLQINVIRPNLLFKVTKDPEYENKYESEILLINLTYQHNIDNLHKIKLKNISKNKFFTALNTVSFEFKSGKFLYEYYEEGWKIDLF